MRFYTITFCSFLFLFAPLSSAATVSPMGSLSQPIIALLELFQFPTGYAQQESAPLVDSDGDGIPDVDDQCPTIPHTSPDPTNTNGCPDIPVSQHQQTASRELRPAPCAQAPCKVIIQQKSDLIPYLDCIFGVLTDAEGTLVLSKGPRNCIEY